MKLSPALGTEFISLIFLFRYSFKGFAEPNFLNEEIKAVDKYLQIQKMRFPKLSLIAVIEVAPISKMLPMPKLCLLTLVENVFFHGDYSNVDHPCSIKFLLVQEEPSMEWVFRVNIANKVQNRGIKFRSGFGASAVFRVLEYEFGDGFHYTCKKSGSNAISHSTPKV
jgi:sensor histidine kinase YesM